MANHGELDDMLEAAKAAATRAYAPYSEFRVGAAVLAEGRIHTGCNVENASYGLTMCAERNALAAAIDGGAKKIEGILIYTETDAPTPPCGACRQVLIEFGPRMKVYLAGRDEKIVTRSLDELLPESFGPHSL